MKRNDFVIYLGKKNEKIEAYVMEGHCDLFALITIIASMLFLGAQIIRSFFQ